MKVEKLDQNDFITMDWKNKQGKTQQVAIYPPGSSVADLDFEWRISIASMQAFNSFSNFAGYDRTILQLDGFQFPMKLIHKNTPNHIVTLRPLEPFNFDGQESIDCDINGFVRDFNVMTKHNLWNSSTETATNQPYDTTSCSYQTTILHFEKTFEIVGNITFLYCVSGGVKVNQDNEEHQIELNGNEALKITESTGMIKVKFNNTPTSVIFVTLSSSK